MIMAYPKGNKNAEKWTKDKVLEVVKKVHRMFTDGDEYSLNGALVMCGLYPDWWAKMAQKFKNDDVVFRAIKGAEGALERKIVNDTSTGAAKSAAFSIFLLKNKFGYKDKTEQDQNVKGQIVWKENKSYESDHKANESD